MRLTVVVPTLLVLGLVFVANALSQEETIEFDMEKMVEIHKTVTTPGPAHATLERFLGRWKSSTKVWMGGPGTPAQVMDSGTSTGKWLMEGRWLVMEGRAQELSDPLLSLMMPTHSVALLGYDNAKKKYVSMMVQDKSTDMVTTLGVADRDGGSIVFYGTIDEPMMAEYDKPVKIAYRFKSQDEIVIDVYDLGIGENHNRVLETTLTRIRAAGEK